MILSLPVAAAAAPREPFPAGSKRSRVVSRQPSEEEGRVCEKHVAKNGTRGKGLYDIVHRGMAAQKKNSMLCEFAGVVPYGCDGSSVDVLPPCVRIREEDALQNIPEVADRQERRIIT